MKKFEQVWLVSVLGAGLLPLAAEAVPPLAGSQQHVEQDFQRWLTRLETFLAVQSKASLDPRELQALASMKQVWASAQAMRPQSNMDAAKRHLVKSQFTEALPLEEIAIQKLHALLYKSLHERPPFPVPGGDEHKTPPPSPTLESSPEEKLAWFRLDTKSGAEDPAAPPPTSKPQPDSEHSGESSVSSVPAPASTYHESDHRKTTPEGRPGLPGGAEWTKLPPRQLERLVETRLDTLPTEFGWRESVKQYFLKINATKHAGRGG